MICDLPQTNLRVGYSGNEPGKLFIAELGGQSVCEVHYTSSLLWCVFEIPYNKFFRRGGTMDENVGECDHHGQAQGSRYTTYFGVYLYVFTMKICSEVVLLKASLSALPCCPRMEHRSSKSCTHNPSPLVTVPASCPPSHPPYLPTPHVLESRTTLSLQIFLSVSAPTHLALSLRCTSPNPICQNVSVEPPNGLL